ncbi:MAG: winged helix-turn-helix domain-containing protein [Promethearchaeota archaeon]
MRNNEVRNEESEISEQELFNIMSHPTRRMILRELGQQLYLAYSELQILIPQSPGVIYHHLEKLQEKRLIQQRESKEYELTSLGIQAVSFLKKLDNGDIPSLAIHLSPFQNLFLVIPLSRIVLKNPQRWVIEIIPFIILLFLIQIDFPVLIVGPFLLPSVLQMHSRVFIEIVIFFLTFLLLFLFSGSPIKRSKDDTFALIAGLLSLPFLSLIASLILYLISIILTAVPIIFFWLLTLMLQFCYAYIIIQLLMKITRLSFDKSIIVTLLMGYFFLLCVFIFG